MAGGHGVSVDAQPSRRLREGSGVEVAGHVGRLRPSHSHVGYTNGRPIYEIRDVIESGFSTDTLISVKPWGPFKEPIVYFSRYVNWWFTGLNRAADTTSATSADDKASSTRLAMVYWDIVQSSLVGNQKHQLLRELTLKDSGGTRGSVEPLHYQWLGVRNNVIEVVHVQLADEDGKFLAIPKGKTMLTVTLKRA